MTLRNPRTIPGAAAVLAALMLLAVPRGEARAELDAGAGAAYRRWLGGLERTVAERADADLPGQRRLFPFDTPAGQADADGPAFRHLVIAKAVAELEETWRDRQGGDGPPALVALANARNYMHLSEYDSALVWYGVADGRDTAHRFRDEIARETLAAAAAAGDSLALARALTNTLGLSSLAGRDREVVLAYRCLLAARDDRAVDLLNGKVAAEDTLLDPRVHYWEAYALAWRGRRAESLAVLTTLLRSGRGDGLDEAARTWVLTAVPDLMFLEGDAAGARPLYGLLAASDVPALRLWGAYQAAGLDLADARYDAAAAGFDGVCHGAHEGAWQDRARALRDVAVRLRDLRKEGEKHGTAAFYDR